MPLTRRGTTYTLFLRYTIDPNQLADYKAGRAFSRCASIDHGVGRLIASARKHTIYSKSHS